VATDAVGLDPAQAVQLTNRLQGAHDTLIASERAIRAAIQSALWSGADAERFRAAWAMTLSGKLRAAAGSLAQEAAGVDQQRREQVAASVSAHVVSSPFATATTFNSNAAVAAVGSLGNLSDSLISSLGELLDDLGDISTMQDVSLGAIDIMALMKQGKSFYEAFATVTKIGAPISKRIPYLGIAVSVTSVLMSANEHGWNDPEVWKEIVNGIGSNAANVAVPVVGGLVWDGVSWLTETSIEAADEKWDFSGAFVASTMARTGEIPDYEGIDGFGRWARDGVLNAFLGW
jgi:hypothetical protein